ncbi:hypothetical protein QYF36_022059 [Acer negundo]|nr:hypothetical protein QYF36_022059 [Acer negundo]
MRIDCIFSRFPTSTGAIRFDDLYREHPRKTFAIRDTIRFDDHSDGLLLQAFAIRVDVQFDRQTTKMLINLRKYRFGPENPCYRWVLRRMKNSKWIFWKKVTDFVWVLWMARWVFSKVRDSRWMVKDSTWLLWKKVRDFISKARRRWGLSQSVLRI